MGQFTSRHGSSAEKSAGRYAAEDEFFSKRFPALFEFVSEQLDEDGVARVPSTILLCCEDGYWKLCLIDRKQKGATHEYTAWKSGSTFEEALCLMDHAIQDGTVEWRKREPWVGKKKG